ncbi:DNA methyltransferase [Luteimonas viscosa]|nr:site-specific DNA-methyltransferase [Luteimonas viscosa]
MSVRKAAKTTKATGKPVAKKAAKKTVRKTAAKPAPAAGADVLARVRGAQQAVAIGKAGGRPMLGWVGKRAPASVQAFPAQLVETYGEETPSSGLWERWPDDLRRGGLLYHGDNKEVLAHLLANGFRGQIKLIYIDPPFDSGADYVRTVELRGPKGKVKLEGEGYTLGEQIQYTDIWANDNYLQFMYERLLLLKELLAEDGSIYVHMDSANVHAIKVVCDEVFGASNFQREIIWRIGWISGYKSAAKNWIRNHDTILFYSKNKDRFTFNKEYIPYPEGYVRRDGAAPDGAGYPIEDTWNCYEIDSLDSIQIMSFNSEKVGYPTQKNENLLSRIVRASSDPGDLILDSFIGSGTTAAVAQKLGRRWIGCDINKGAIQTTAKRLQLVMADQAGEKGKPAQGKLLGDGDAPSPAQIGFTHWRVNDYDLAIQHNEAVNLACEYLGVERLRNDAYFDGLLGKRLVKIIPFGHPLSPMDLEAVKNELDARPEEDRAITVVCLGKELASDTWLAEWNRLRKKKTDPHHIEVIELRNDPRYGGFIQHEHAAARVAVKRKDGKLHVEIKDFVSPGILQRLAQQSGVVQAKVADWRAMVDSVMIDTAYDGAVFNVVHADVPARKADFVAGEYTLDAPDDETAVTVKITDMLGEEVMVTCRA